MSKRKKLVCGIGINDSDTPISYKNSSGELVRCPFYARWSKMIERSYSKKLHKKFPTYMECEVSEDWKKFSNFKKWMVNQDWEGKHLDKDILIYGNKIYSEKTCIFVTPEINNLLTNINKNTGVTYSKKSKLYQSSCRVNGIKKHVGFFTSEVSAMKAYRSYKSTVIINIAMKEIENENLELGYALFRIASLFRINRI